MTYLNFIRALIKAGIIFSLIFLLIFTSCISRQKYAKETKYFEKYLTHLFNRKIAERLEFFFIIPNNGCHGCRSSVLSFILSKDFNSKCFGIISQPDDDEFQSLQKLKSVLIDEKGVIDRLNLKTENPVLIITADQNIKDIIPITAENSSNLKQFLIQK